MDAKILGFSLKEAWSIFHGVILGGSFLLLFPVVIAGLFLLGRNLISERKKERYVRFLIYAALAVTVLTWLTNIVGTYLPYPWYRAEPPEGAANLLQFPRSYLLSVPHLAVWHEVGMQWKEFLGWSVSILCTPAVYILSSNGKFLGENSKLRIAVLTLLIIAFIAGGITGLIGILVTKLAPVR